MADNKGILVCGEIAEGKLAAITLELLGCARKLAGDLAEEVAVVFVGSGVKDIAPTAIAYGADKVYVADQPALADYQADSYLAVVEQASKQLNPRIILFGQTSLGRDLSPRLAFRLGCGLAMDCVELAIDPASKLLQQSRPVYGGNARAVFTSESFPQMATVRAKAMSSLPADSSRQGQVVPLEVTIDPAAAKTKTLKKVKQEVAGVKLEDAEVIVSGGRGIGSTDNFKPLEELAKLLKGAVGASRPPCDNGWMPATLQVGLTGKIVAPNLYIAVAISGASQHMAGCSGAKNIVAINKDPEANIFKEARFGVVGDYKQVLPGFTAKLKELLAG